MAKDWISRAAEEISDCLNPDLSRFEIETLIRKHAPEWVRVSKDEEPPCGCIYLVYCYDWDDPTNTSWQDIASYTYHGGWATSTGQRVIVTAYMPLPAPPEVALLEGKGE